ncbi:DedD protein [Halopseudomonas litoralis]|uniref:DedD protein n=1 Tax=Halopseudomonas litoralis TaxID=797277 RepID=A0A1H1RYP2_9GAMM|nr:SPOR domain-containing protein [Halopseudomonas litoralis]SDS40844.1 DedD protein [Halopseudomonas litoralis]
MDEGLKQRIIGALVLVVAAVVFLPMLLSGQDETEQVEVEVPEAPVLDEREIAVAVPPILPEPAPVPDMPQSAPGDSTATPLPQTASIEPAAPVVTEPDSAVTPSEPEPEPAPVEQPPAAAVTAGGWVIQQASFSSTENADSFRQTLAGQGYNAYTRSAQSNGKTIVRVFIGPLESREAAARVRDELQRRHQSKGLILAQDDGNRAR